MLPRLLRFWFALVAVLPVVYPLQGQDIWSPEEYGGIPETDRKMLVNDQFGQLPSFWEAAPSYQRDVLMNGEWTCESQTAVPTFRRRKLPLDLRSQFEAEISMRLAKGSALDAVGLYLGQDAAGRDYGFLFNGSQAYTVVRSESGRITPLFPWKASDRINRYASNQLTFRQALGKWYFFINRSLVHEMDALPMQGRESGLFLGGMAAAGMDAFRVSEFQSMDRLGPRILITEPNLNASHRASFTSSHQKIQGRVTDVGGVAALYINKEPISIINQGDFIASIDLPPGETEIMIEAIDRFNNRTETRFFMDYLPATTEAPYGSAVGYGYTPSFTGRNYLLLIGIDKYRFWNQLHNAVRDCNDLRGILTAEYDFDNNRVMTLYNEAATRENIQDSLEKLKGLLTPNDNLVIYYAGHGYYDPEADLGFWVPVDARLTKVSDFIRNSTLHDYIKSIKTRHTFLIADACYAGSLFSSSRAVINEGNRSRWAFTSGGIEKVLDGQPGENSPFARYLITYLHNNPRRKIRADELIQAVSPIVERNTRQTPIGSSLQGVGDEGGVFIFYRK
jgi:hypothetical protein